MLTRQGKWPTAGSSDRDLTRGLKIRLPHRTKREHADHMADAQSRGDYWSSLTRRERQSMLSAVPAATLPADALEPVMDEAGFGRRTR